MKKAYRDLAKSAHPDAGGSEDKMKSLNEAYEVALKVIAERKDPKCVCLGFTRNPLCNAHEVPKNEVQCSLCGGLKKVPVGPGYIVIMMDCPECC